MRKRLLTLLNPSEDWTEVEEAVRMLRAKTMMEQQQVKAICPTFIFCISVKTVCSLVTVIRVHCSLFSLFGSNPTSLLSAAPAQLFLGIFFCQNQFLGILFHTISQNQ